MADDYMERVLLKARERPVLPSDPLQLAQMALALDAKAAAGPWNACHDGECPCKQVWHSDFPVAEVTHGDWGDEYPAMRFAENGGLHGTTVEAFMEKMVYGSVGKELATANAQFIALARTALPILARTILAMSHYGVQVGDADDR